MCLSALTPRDRFDKISRHLPYSWSSNCLMAHRANALARIVEQPALYALSFLLQILSLRVLTMAAAFFRLLSRPELTMVSQAAGKLAEAMQLAAPLDCCGTVDRPKDGNKWQQQQRSRK